MECSMAYFFLFVAIFFEVAATIQLIAAEQFTKLTPTISLLICYGFSLYFLSIVVQDLPVAIVYGIWSAVGIAIIALLGFLVYEQALNWQSIVGLVLVVIGVTLLVSYAPTIE